MTNGINGLARRDKVALVCYFTVVSLGKYFNFELLYFLIVKLRIWGNYSGSKYLFVMILDYFQYIFEDNNTDVFFLTLRISVYDFFQ